LAWQIGEELGDGRWRAPSAERNRGPILEVLMRVLPPRGLVLEIGSGTGEHVAHFAKALPQLTWQPSEPDATFRDSIALWVRHEQLGNVREPLALDVRERPWPVDAADAVVCINVIHVSPWATTLDLLAGAQDILPAGGVLYCYGPYRRHGRHTAPSNEAFDAKLRAYDPAWGLRDIEQISAAADRVGMDLAEVVDMPANNFSLALRKRSAARRPRPGART
jgi:SAM-dependent methyltransferase